MATLIEKDIYKMIVGLLKFPYPQICRHLVALELLSLLEKNGYEISKELAKNIFQLVNIKDKYILQKNQF